MDENNICNDSVTRIFKMKIESKNQEKYLEVTKGINDYLKEKYSNYFICFILLQDKEDDTIIYNVELYNNIEDEENTYKKLSQEVQAIYDKEIGSKLKRTLLEDIEEINRIFPN